jgi:hypothetical protein
MKTLNFKTNINCVSCVAKVTPYLDSDNSIEAWQVDTNSLDKILSVKGDIVSATVIKEIIASAGFKVIEEMPGHTNNNLRQSFWSNKTTWRRAGFNTLNCLIGCSIGDFGTIIYFQSSHHHISMWLMMGLAIVAGLTTSIILETIILKVKEGFQWLQALSMAFSMSFISMVAMELSENATDYILTGGGNIPLNSAFYWIALGISLIMGFIIPLPYNYYKLQKYGVTCH